MSVPGWTASRTPEDLKVSAPRSCFGYWQRVDVLIRLALEEDLPGPDLTSEAVLDEDREAAAVLIAREGITVSGLAVAARVFEKVDPVVRWEPLAADGGSVAAGSVLARVKGNARSLMAAERTALNFLQHLSGIATASRAMVDAVSERAVLVMDTRKTLPGWRLLQKRAVRDGGGTNHRFSLSDGILIKDNHAALAGGVGEAVRRARSRVGPGVRIEAEAATVGEVSEAIEAGADVVLVDNVSPSTLRDALETAGGRVPLEASGGVRIDNIRDVAETGVAMISVGALTHSVRAVDIAMEMEVP